MFSKLSFISLYLFLRCFLASQTFSSNNATMSYRLGHGHNYEDTLLVARQANSCPVICSEGEQLCPGTQNSICGTSCCTDSDGDFSMFLSLAKSRLKSKGLKQSLPVMVTIVAIASMASLVVACCEHAYSLIKSHLRLSTDATNLAIFPTNFPYF
jgi:hypothetical protein